MNRWLNKAKETLILSSVQSMGATVGIPLVSYFMSGGAVSDTMWYMVFSLVFLHLGVFSHNDIADIHHDTNGGRTDKPLVSKRLSKKFAVWYSWTMITVGVFLSVYGVNEQAVSFLIVGLLTGILYNYTSSSTALGVPLLGVWGVVIVLYGGQASGSLTTPVQLFSVLTGLSLALVTFYADAVDVYSDESSLPIVLGYAAMSRGDIISSSRKSNSFLLGMVSLQVMLFGYILDVGAGYFWLTISMFALAACSSIYMEFIILDTERFRKSLVIYTLSSVGFLVMSAAPYAGELVVTYISAGIIGWAILSMKVLYGGGLNYA